MDSFLTKVNWLTSVRPFFSIKTIRRGAVAEGPGWGLVRGGLGMMCLEQVKSEHKVGIHAPPPCGVDHLCPANRI